jgi:hypothetical protein
VNTVQVVQEALQLVGGQVKRPLKADYQSLH